MDNKDNFEILAKRLKQIRTEIGVTQKEFAQEMGFTSVTLSAYENSLKRPSLDLILGIAKKCNVSLDWLCGLSDTKSEEDNQQYKTYSDILKSLIDINNVTRNIITNITFNIKMDDGTIREVKDDSAIIYLDSTLRKYLADWSKFQNLFGNDIIDKSIYVACIEKLLRDSDIPIRENLDDYDLLLQDES